MSKITPLVSISSLPNSAPTTISSLAVQQARLFVHMARLLSRLVRSLHWDDLSAAERKRLARILARLESDLVLARLAVANTTSTPPARREHNPL